MRQDIQFLLVERERVGSSFPNNKTALNINPSIPEWDDVDCGPTRASSSRRRQGQKGGAWWHKTINENPNPLRRFLWANVGRPWNDIHSEVCSRVDARSVSGMNVRNHLKWMVEKQVMMVNGEPYSLRGYHLYKELYVNPETGILCSTSDCSRHGRHYRRDASHIPITMVKVNGDLDYYERENGIWYRFIRELPPQTYDIIIYEESTDADRILYNLKAPGDSYARPRKNSGFARLISKKQASKREIRWIKEQIAIKNNTFGYDERWGRHELVRITN